MPLTPLTPRRLRLGAATALLPLVLLGAACTSGTERGDGGPGEDGDPSPSGPPEIDMTRSGILGCADDSWAVLDPGSGKALAEVEFGAGRGEPSRPEAGIVADLDLEKVEAGDPSGTDCDPTAVAADLSYAVVEFGTGTGGSAATDLAVITRDGGAYRLLPAPEKEEGFTDDSAVSRLQPMIDHEAGRILYVEAPGDGAFGMDGVTKGTVKSFEIATGEVRSLGECGGDCENLEPVPGTGSAALLPGDSPLVTSADGKALFWAVPGQSSAFDLFTAKLADIPENSLVAPFDPTGAGVEELDWSHRIELAGPEDDRTGPSAAVDTDGPGFAAPDASTFLVLDDASGAAPFQRYRVTAEDLETNDTLPNDPDGQYDVRDGDLPEPLAPDEVEFPDVDRDNARPVVSPEGDLLLFASTGGSGKTSWFTVPVDGGDPEEIGPAPEAPVSGDTDAGTAYAPVRWQ
jgi:hypothetical protein